ncbi:MAG: hypothetical protein NC307_00345 [Roseburia sp.]|nr:hypothetical protein [Roseburia sp.]
MRLRESEKDVFTETQSGADFRNSIKTLDSLLAKVIVKRHEQLGDKDKPYYRIDASNYKELITDIVGVRLIINYRGFWKEIHDQIKQMFPYGDIENYNGVKTLPHPKNGENLLAEIPQAYYAEGDDISEYEKLEKLIEPKQHEMGYRSVHYVVSYKGIYMEIQVRTIYDEAWSDCDHNYVYKKDEKSSHSALCEMSKILCQMTNVSSDIGDSMWDIYNEDKITDLKDGSWEAPSDIINLLDKSVGQLKRITENLQRFKSSVVERRDIYDENAV